MQRLGVSVPLCDQPECLPVNAAQLSTGGDALSFSEILSVTETREGKQGLPTSLYPAVSLTTVEVEGWREPANQQAAAVKAIPAGPALRPPLCRFQGFFSGIWIFFFPQDTRMS